jgi:hypothetical protein
MSPSAGTMRVPLGYDPRGKMEPRDVVAAKDGWSEYTLTDGSVIRLKAMLVDAKRAVDQYGDDGNPTYVFQFVVANQVIAPDNLKKQR